MAARKMPTKIFCADWQECVLVDADDAFAVRRVGGEVALSGCIDDCSHTHKLRRSPNKPWFILQNININAHFKCKKIVAAKQTFLNYFFLLCTHTVLHLTTRIHMADRRMIWPSYGKSWYWDSKRARDELSSWDMEHNQLKEDKTFTSADGKTFHCMAEKSMDSNNTQKEVMENGANEWVLKRKWSVATFNCYVGKWKREI